MRMYGVVAYGSFSKDPKVVRSLDLIQVRLKGKNLKPPLRIYRTQNGWDIATPLIRVSEHLLGLPNGSIRYNFGIEKYKNHANEYGGISMSDLTNTVEGRMCVVQLKEILSHIKLGQHKPNSHEAKCQAYILSFIGTMVAFGQRLFLSSALSDTPMSLDEVKMLKLIRNRTRLQGSVVGTPMRYFEKLGFQAEVYDVTNFFTDSYNKLVLQSIDIDRPQLRASLNQMTSLLKTTSRKAG